MKHSLLFIYLFALLASCSAQTTEAVFYDEHNTNRCKELLSFNNRLYILGQHNIKEGSIERTTSILCTDTLLKKIWDINLGNYKLDERFENFTIDKSGNLYITGHNTHSKSALLLKISGSGQLSWRKEFKQANSFNQIKLLNDSSLVIACTKSFQGTSIINDSAFIQKMDLRGNTVWETPLCIDGGLRFLELVNDKIVCCLNAGIFNGSFPNSKCFFISGNGKIERSLDLDQTETGIDLGVKVIRLKADKMNHIHIVAQSHNQYNLKIKLLQYDGSGTRLGTVDYVNDQVTVPEEGTLFLNVGLNLWRGENKAQAIVIKENKGKYYFTLMDTDNNTVFKNSIELNKSVYTISDVQNPEKYTSKWKISKTK